jgi:hypothetical protein
MNPDQFERLLEQEAGGSSDLSEGAYEIGRDLAHLPD